MKGDVSAGREGWFGIGSMGIHPRKEVIQPQLPLRLPCYDFTPIISPTLTTCAPMRGSLQPLQVLPTLVV